MSHYFWIYRQRAPGESDQESLRLALHEYQSLRAMLVARWPELRKMRMLPASGTGIRLWITIDKPEAAIERFLTDCLGGHNATKPAARLRLERSSRGLLATK